MSTMHKKLLKLATCLALFASTNITTPGCTSCEVAKNKRKQAKSANKTTKQTSKNTKKGSTNMTNITRTPSGLGYEVIKAGTGAQPKPGQTVTVHYTGWLDDNGKPGKKFDSSVDRNDPFSTKIGVGYVIAGWDEAVLNMKVGEKVRLYIPAKLAYGSRGAGAAIPPNANLIFDVELLAIN